MKENVLERMERLGTKQNIEAFNDRMLWPYEDKVNYAKDRALEFVSECERRNLNYHVSVGGLDSITLLLFLRSIGIDAPGISASFLEDPSIQKIHRQLGVEQLRPLKRDDGSYWTQAKVIQEFGFPVLSKEIAAKIELLQNATEKNKTVRHAIITGETGDYGGNRTGTRMQLPDRWLWLFGGADPEGAALGYAAASFKVSSKCCYYLKERPCDIWAKEHNSVPFLGLMASEGGRREKSLKMNGCNYFGRSTIRSCPFAIFDRQDLLQLAVDLSVPVPEIYGEIVREPNGKLRTTGAQRTGCAMCGFGIHLEDRTREPRPHRFDQLRHRNPKQWEYLMYHMCKDANGNDFGWGLVLDYIGVGWEDDPYEYEQLDLFGGGDEDG